MPVPRFLAVLFLVGGALSVRAAEPLSFNRDIRPILSENCFRCHGPDASTREAELRLDLRDEAIAAKAIAPGHPDKSELVARILDADPDTRMPPVDSNRSLTPAQRETLKRWVAEGAPYEAHWAYVPPRRPTVPAVAAGAAQPGNPIDAFIGAALARENLRPAPDADRATLIRRLSFDLTGLPPAPADVAAFVASRDPQAYAQLVKKYLASPHYGERLALPWLDLVRYADTIGFHNDVALSYWPYRDYVIEAFNRNLPFDQFTREQLAGDLLPNSTISQRVASGYNRLHRISGEGGIQDKEYLAKYSADRVRTTATAWLGSTLACAECHDHKFDPFSAKDFYRFAAIFADLHEKGAYNLSGGFTRENLAEETIFSSDSQKQRFDALVTRIAGLDGEIKAIGNEALATSRATWESETLAAAAAGTLAWRPLPPVRVESPHGTVLTIEAEDHSVVPSGRNPPNDTYSVTVAAPAEAVTAVRFESIADPRFPGDEVSRSGSAFFISELEVLGQAAGAAVPEILRIAAVRSATSAGTGYPVEAGIDGNPKTSLSFVRQRGAGVALELSEPWRGGVGSTLTLRIRHADDHAYQNLGRFRVSVHTRPAAGAFPDSVPPAVLKALKVEAATRTEAQEKEIATYYRAVAPELAALRSQRTAAVNERDTLMVSLPSMPVSKSVAPRPIRVLPRANWMDDSGEIVESGVPVFLGGAAARETRFTRLDLAEWLVAPENPLTARTFVNRLWRIYFGHGLTRTLEDLGSQGEWPSHPELLDWLAVEFCESGWNVKHLVELIVTSRTYRQSSQPVAEAEERDPTNRWLSRQNRFRLDAELVRDNALAISGLLSTKLGGPSARPYQPEGYYAPLNFPRREYAPDRGEQLYRRGVYTHWQRSFLLPSFITFDAPSREECTANRSPSNTPLQALVLLNDPTFVEAARVLAEKIMQEGGPSFEARLKWTFARALARSPTPHEIGQLHRLFELQHARYKVDEPAARELISTGEAPRSTDLAVADLAAWTSVARAVLNLHETITRF